MIERELLPRGRDNREAADRVELFHSFIVNYLIQHPVYKLNKDFAKHIDDAVVSLEKAKIKIDYEDSTYST
jgi:hypothetical protein